MTENTCEDITEYFRYKEKGALYHYTSSQGLLGILRSESLWFTDARYLNDESEGLIIYDLILETVSNHQDLKFKNVVQEFVKREKSYYEDNEEELCERDKNVISTNKRYYICSFSKNPDNLSLWRNYTKTDTCAGYNLAFENLSESISPSEKQPLEFYGIYRVIYDLQTQKDIVKKCIEGYYPLWKQGKRDIMTKFAFLINLCKFSFKQESFKSEEEVRVVVSDDLRETESEELKIRNVKDFFAPYYEVPIKLASIKAIGISPTIKSQLSINSMYYLKKKYGLFCEIKKSNIPLRY